jgi:hypothetical protein
LPPINDKHIRDEISGGAKAMVAVTFSMDPESPASKSCARSSSSATSWVARCTASCSTAWPNCWPTSRAPT